MLHSLTIIGRVGTPPQQKFTNSGKAVTEFSVAVEEKKGETHWYNVAVWGDKSDRLCGLVGKGAIVAVIGKPAARAYLKDGSAKLAEGISVNSAWDVKIIQYAKDGPAPQERGGLDGPTAAFDDWEQAEDLGPLSPGS